MKATIKRKINSAEVEFELEEQKMDTLLSLITTLSVKDVCPDEVSVVDENGNVTDKKSGFLGQGIKWETNKSKSDKGTFMYIKRKVWNENGDMATSTLGQYQDGDGYFWKPFEIFKKSE